MHLNKSTKMCKRINVLMILVLSIVPLLRLKVFKRIQIGASSNTHLSRIKPPFISHYHISRLSHSNDHKILTTTWPFQRWRTSIEIITEF